MQIPDDDSTHRVEDHTSGGVHGLGHADTKPRPHTNLHQLSLKWLVAVVEENTKQKLPVEEGNGEDTAEDGHSDDPRVVDSRQRNTWDHTPKRGEKCVLDEGIRCVFNVVSGIASRNVVAVSHTYVINGLRMIGPNARTRGEGRMRFR